MKMKEIISGVILFLIALVIGIFIYLGQGNNKEDENNSPSIDEINFKNEYENTNQAFPDDGSTPIIIDIPLLSGVKYIEPDSAVDIIKNKDGIIYFGFPECPWCRSILPTLLKSLENNGITKFYYLNISDIRSEYSLDDSQIPVKEKEGTNAYYQLLDILSDHLRDYELPVYDKSGKVTKYIKTGEKRLSAPTVLFIRDGFVVDIIIGTVSTFDNPYIPMTKDQEEELNEMYANAIKKVNGTACNEEC